MAIGDVTNVLVNTGQNILGGGNATIDRYGKLIEQAKSAPSQEDLDEPMEQDDTVESAQPSDPEMDEPMEQEDDAPAPVPPPPVTGINKPDSVQETLKLRQPKPAPTLQHKEPIRKVTKQPGLGNSIIDKTIKAANIAANYTTSDAFDKDPIINVGVDKHTKMSYWPAKGLQKGITEAKKAGITIDDFGPLTSYRSFDQQAGLHGSLAAGQAGPAGQTKETGSLHQFGFAVDISSDNYPELDKVMEKYGFARPWSAPGHREQHHYSFQPALSANDPERVWKDTDPRMSLWKNTTGFAPMGTIDDTIVSMAAMHGFGPKATSVVDRLFSQESGKRTHAEDGSIIRSPAGAIGIGQMMPGTLQPYLQDRGISREDYRDNPSIQVDIAVEHFSKLVSSYGGNMAKALAAYNGGARAVETAEAGEWNMDSPDPSAYSNETLDYVANILQTDRDTAYRWISQPEGSPDAGPMADKVDATAANGMRKGMRESVSHWQEVAFSDPNSMDSSIGDFKFKREVQAATAAKMDQAAEDGFNGGKVFLRGMTAMVLDTAANEMKSWRSPRVSADHSALSIGDAIPIYNVGKDHAKAAGISEPVALLGDKVHALAQYIAPSEEPTMERKQWDKDIAKRRGGKEGMIAFAAALPWSPKEGGVDMSWEAAGANMEALGLELPYLLGTIAGGLLLGPEGAMGTKAGAPVMEGLFGSSARTLRHWATNPVATGAVSRIGGLADALTLGAAGGLKNAGKKIVGELGATLDDTLAYAGIGAAQIASENYSRTLEDGGTFQEATASAITGMFMGGLMGLALPLAVPAAKAIGGAAAKGASRPALDAGLSAMGIPNTLPHDVPWKSYAGNSVLEWVRAADEMYRGGKPGEEYGLFTKHFVTKALPFIKQQVHQYQRHNHVINTSNEFKRVGTGYEKTATDLTSQIRSQQEYKNVLTEAITQANDKLTDLHKNTNLKTFGTAANEQIKKLDELQKQIMELPGKSPEERTVWANTNQRFMQEAKAKDLDDLLSPQTTKKGKVTTKADDAISEQRDQILAEADRHGITPMQLANQRKAQNALDQAKDRLGMLENSELFQKLPEMEGMVSALNNVAQQLYKRADWMVENINNPFEHLHPTDKTVLGIDPVTAQGLDTEVLQANIDVFNGQMKKLAKDMTWMGAAGDAVAFEATRMTRTVLEAQGVTPDGVLQAAKAGAREGQVNVAADISQMERSIELAKSTIKRIEDASTPERRLARADRELAVYRNRFERAQEAKEKLEIERDFLQKAAKEYDRSGLDVDASTENIGAYRDLARNADKKVRIGEKLVNDLKELRRLSGDKSVTIEEAKRRIPEEGLQFNYGKMAEQDRLIESSSKVISRTNKKIDGKKRSLREMEAAVKEARNLSRQAHENVDRLTKKRELEKRLAVVEERLPAVTKEFNKGNSDLQAFNKLFDKREAKLQKGRELKAEELAAQIAKQADLLENLQGVAGMYKAGEEAFAAAQERVLAYTPSTRPGDKGDPAKFFTEMGAPNVLSKGAEAYDQQAAQAMVQAAFDPIQATNPLAQTVKRFSQLSPDQRKAMYARELMAASDNFLDKVFPAREAQRAAGVSNPDFYQMFDESLFSPEQGITGLLPKEVHEAFYSLRSSEIDAGRVANNPLSGLPSSVSRGVVTGLKNFIDLSIPQSITGALQRGRNAFKTMTHQFNHSQQVGARVRDSWNHVMNNLDESLVTGKGGKRMLKPEISGEMMGAIEGMLQGPQQMREFLTKYPQMKKPMEMFLGVSRVLEQYKVSSPELSAMFRDGYFTHVYPRAAELKARGYSPNWKRISSQMGSENRRQIDTLAEAADMYKSAFDEIQTAPGWTATENKMTANAKEKYFIDAEQNTRLRILDRTDPSKMKENDTAANWVLDRLSLKDPVKDPGEIMGKMIQSVMDTSATRNAIKNVASVTINKMIDNGAGKLVPMNVLMPRRQGTASFMVPTAEGKEAPMRVLSDVKELGIHAEDEIVFAGQAHKAKNLLMHPDFVSEFVDNFANKIQNNPKSRAFTEMTRQFNLMGSPMAHSWNILAGHWQTLSTNAITGMWNSAWKGADALMLDADPKAAGQGVKEFFGAAKDFVKAPIDALGMGLAGNKMMKGEYTGLDPQMLVSDFLIHGGKMDMWNTMIKEMQEATFNLVRRDDPVLAEDYRPNFAERIVERGADASDTWDKVVGRDGIWGNWWHDVQNSTDPALKTTAKAAGTFIKAGTETAMKVASDADYFLNNYMTYEPMKQAALAAYNIQAAIHWERMGPDLMKTRSAPEAIRMVKEEAARYVNGRMGMLQHYQRINMGKDIDVEGTLYGTTGTQKTNISAALLNATTPGWLRSKVDLISNGTWGRRLADIEDVQFRQYMQTEWRKQLFFGAATAIGAQQILKWCITGGEASVFAGVLTTDPDWEKIREDIQDPKQLKEIPLGSNTVINTPFFGQFRDVASLLTGSFIRPEAAADMLSGNINKLGVAAIETMFNRDLQTGRKVSYDDSSLPGYGGGVKYVKDAAKHVGKRLGDTFTSEVLMYENKGEFMGGRKPLSHVAMGLMGLNVRSYDPYLNLNSELKGMVSQFEGETVRKADILVRQYVKDKDWKKLNEAAEVLALGEPVSGKALQMGTLFPGGRAPVDPNKLGDMLLKYEDSKAYVLNTKDEKLQAELAELIRRAQQRQSSLYGEKVYKAVMSESKK